MTQADAAKDAARGTTIIDRKTLARIDRGEEVKLETLEKLAKRLGVPTSYFDSPSDNSVAQAGQPDELTLHTVDAEGLADLLKSNVGGRLQWQLNVHQLDDEAVSVLEQLERAVDDLRGYLETIGYNRFISATDLRSSNPEFLAREKVKATQLLGSLSIQDRANALDARKARPNLTGRLAVRAQHRVRTGYCVRTPLGSDPRANFYEPLDPPGFSLRADRPDDPDVVYSGSMKPRIAGADVDGSYSDRVWPPPSAAA